MSELLVLNFDMQSSPTIDIKPPTNTDESSGWGFAWYPNDDNSASLMKDSTLQPDDTLSSHVSRLKNFRSTVFMCKTKCAARHYTMHDVQPFSWSYAGKDWLFAHNGNLDKTELKNIHTDDLPFLTPLGTTDSEILFCYLLSKIHASGAKKLHEIDGNQLLEWLAELEPLGSMDIALSDHSSLLIYHGINSSKDILLTRILPPHSPSLLMESNSLTLRLDNHKDEYSSCFIACSEILSNTQQTPMLPGQLVFVRRGALVWQGENIPTATNNLPPSFSRNEGS